MGRSKRTIITIDKMVNSLPKDAAMLLQRIFDISVVEGTLKPTESMLPWIKERFGSVDAVSEQKITKITNLVTFEGAMFNSLRALRPRQREDRLRVEAGVLDKAMSDPLANPLKDTPEDPFGRVYGKYSVTASNIAKYEGLHALIIFNDYNPLAFSREEIVDYIDTGWKWAQQAHRYDTSANYYFFLWNSLKKAGASLAHGHAQVVLGRGSHYAKVEALRHAALRYKADYSSDYFHDLYRVHRELGLGWEKDGIRMMVYLAPVKEKEVMILSDKLDSLFGEAVYEVLACFRDELHVTAFNVGIATPPLVPTQEDWTGFPVIARIVDRGYPWDGSSDFGTMELYAASVISSDPFQVAEVLKGEQITAA